MSHRCGHVCVRAVGAALATVAIASAAQAGQVHPTTIRIMTSDGFDSGAFVPKGREVREGVFNYARNRYRGTTNVWNMDWDFNAVPRQNGAAWVTGNFVVRNDAGETMEFEIEVTMPLVGPVEPDDYLGSAAVTIARGTLAALPEDALWSGLNDARVEADAYPWPWSLSADGTDQDTRNVTGAHRGAVATIGLRLAFSLTPGARMTVTSIWAVEGAVSDSFSTPAARRAADALAHRRADVDRSGDVDLDDVAAVLGGWGLSAWGRRPIAGDVNGDGFVGTDDLVAVLDALAEPADRRARPERRSSKRDRASHQRPGRSPTPRRW